MPANLCPADISVSVVLYKDYKSPLEMLVSLREFTNLSLRTSVYVVDNSCLEEGDPLCVERDRFRETITGYGPIEYIDAGANLGFGAANNLALMKSNARYHAFINPDVLFIEDALSELKSFMEANSDCGMCIPRMTDEAGEMQQVYRREVTVLDAFNRMFLKSVLRGRDRWHCMQDEDYSKPFQVPFGQGSFLFGRTSLLKDLGGFDDRFFMYLEDADLCKRVNAVSKLLYCPDATVIHKWERGSHKNISLLKHHLRSYALYFHKWGLRIS